MVRKSGWRPEPTGLRWSATRGHSAVAAHCTNWITVGIEALLRTRRNAALCREPWILRPGRNVAGVSHGSPLIVVMASHGEHPDPGRRTWTSVAVPLRGAWTGLHQKNRGFGAENQQKILEDVVRAFSGGTGRPARHDL